MRVETVKWVNGKIRLIDQTLLPHSLKYLYCSDIKTLWDAIYTLRVRGAPAIGIAAGFGAVLAAKLSKARTYAQFKKDVIKEIRYLKSSRPTAINLFWALERMEKVLDLQKKKPVERIKKALLAEANRILKEDRVMCRKMGSFGSDLVKNNDRILTLCNAGALATSDYGTALGVVYTAKAKGKNIKVYACETRPLLQGARLTMWELLKNKIDATLICDSMAATLMRQKMVDKVFVGTDRIASNGDAANKIGTYNLAVLAKYHRIPFYVVAPSSSFDLRLKCGGDIPIEERRGDEVREVFGKKIAPINAKVYNPAFDVTPNDLITAIVTEKGIFRKPYIKSLRKLKG
ncbi:MAG: S-methyl-5-thioribose-1-phosphate isomerase [Candidatus Omnitrophica bacterium CG07_land_8_20_14_0_80_42_15]|uniref:Methylthioribose-1-phosphate isomerase n=1 Tax=Candidatus Aquitaenariimonas noxiae TaxID=1974741 RepID=A0A2J0L6F5_9BACT|nr:MAG: S-methyl-5-thioribose-1-phosphate isomerase [Candidatus Omnitrophica bacterium CG07_land_8_20_14_0_80_42_15]